MTFLRNRRVLWLASSIAALFVVAGQTFAAGHLTGGVVNYSTDIATALVGLLAGIAASIAAAFAVAGLVRATKTGARQALKAMGLIK